MLRSLWFRLTGTVVALVIFTLGLSFLATLVIAGRQLSEFIQSTSDEIIRITAPADLVSGLDTGTGLSGLQINEDGQGGLEISGGNRDGIKINPDGGVTINSTDPAMSQIDVQIPEIVRSQSAQLARDVKNTIMFAVSAASVLAMIAGTWLFWQITRPLARLRDATVQIAAGKLNTRVQVKSKDEVGQVGMAFNRMAGELQRQEGLRKQMVADIAHELRTPLSVMQINLEAMTDDLLPASTEELGGLHHEVIRLSRLVEDLRLLSLADAGDLQLRSDTIDANVLVKSAVGRMNPQAESRGVTLVAALHGTPAPIIGDEDKLQQVLANLVSNALRFTPAGKRVEVSVHANRQQVMMRVSDQGPGIDPVDLPDMFERFYKGDRSRSRNDSGSGLGLSIVKQLVDLHGGKVQAALPASGGLQVTIWLPAASANSVKAPA